MGIYKIGQLYQANMHQWLTTSDLRWNGVFFELRLFIPDVSNKEQEAFNSYLELGLVVEQPAVILIYNFDSILIADCPFSFNAIPKCEQPDLATLVSAQLNLCLVLVDASSGIIVGLRIIEMPPGFSAMLIDAIIFQYRSEYSDLEFRNKITSIFKRHPNPVALSKDAQCKAIFLSETTTQ